MHFGGGGQDLDRMVADSFKIADRVQELRDIPACFLSQAFAAQLDEISSQLVLVHIDLVLRFLHADGVLLIIFINQRQR
ncbi:hypothetical protein SDC9_198545 [bioreactor metagenome]|uniref:Uncharacterized protein n=1 Tax=bioreactor metagenome TaxID=1076179 RepID=A0A645IHZ8_9ZZZZ